MNKKELKKELAVRNERIKTARYLAHISRARLSCGPGHMREADESIEELEEVLNGDRPVYGWNFDKESDRYIRDQKIQEALTFLEEKVRTAEARLVLGYPETGLESIRESEKALEKLKDLWAGEEKEQ